MRLLDRYIGVSVVRGTVLAMTVLLALFAFIDFVHDLDSIGKGKYTLLRAFEHMVLSLPQLLFSLFPVAALIGSLMGLGTLAGRSELIAMRASGVSPGRMAFSVMKVGAVLALIALLIGELLVPFTERLAQERRSVALTNQITLRTGYGLWLRDGLSFINIRKILPNNRMGEVYIYEFDDARRLRVSTYAKSARYENGKWLLEDIRQSEVQAQANGVVRRTLDQAPWDSPFAPELVKTVAVKPESLSAVGLYRYIRYLRNNGQSTTRYELALWSKIIYPLATGVMIFLAIPLVLGQLRSMGLGQRILTGTLVGLSFHIIQQTAVQFGVVYEANPLLNAAGPTLVFLGLGVWMMRRVR